jgi:hypothetical protein
MPDHTDIPPVIQTLGDDLLAAMKEAAARGVRSPRLWAPTIVAGWTPKRSATAAVVAVGAVTAALVLATIGGRPPNAFADWSATPTSPTTGQLRAAEAACQRHSPDLGSLQPTIFDFRGHNAVLVYSERTTATMCDSGPVAFGTSVSAWAADTAPVAAGAIVPETSEVSAVRTGQLFLKLAGRVGIRVHAVILELADGRTVAATVANGWFAAWWPASRTGGARGQGGPIGHALVRAARITSASGTTTQPLKMVNLP